MLHKLHHKSSVAVTLRLAAACVLILVACVQAFVAEYRVVLHLNGTTNDLIATLDSQETPRLQPFGARTARDLMVACGRTLTLAPRLKTDAALFDRVSAACDESANLILINAPSYGRARAVKLITSETISPRLYDLAQSAAPYEPWALNQRLFALAGDSSLSGNVMVLAQADFGRALRSDWGRMAVAALYRDRAELRPAITRAAELLPATDQAAFVAQLRQLMRSAG